MVIEIFKSPLGRYTLEEEVVAALGGHVRSPDQAPMILLFEVIEGAWYERKVCVAIVNEGSRDRAIEIVEEHFEWKITAPRAYKLTDNVKRRLRISRWEKVVKLGEG